MQLALKGRILDICIFCSTPPDPINDGQCTGMFTCRKCLLVLEPADVVKQVVFDSNGKNILVEVPDTLLPQLEQPVASAPTESVPFSKPREIPPSRARALQASLNTKFYKTSEDLLDAALFVAVVPPEEIGPNIPETQKLSSTALSYALAYFSSQAGEPVNAIVCGVCERWLAVAPSGAGLSCKHCGLVGDVTLPPEEAEGVQ
jgi:hypothetical protein